MSANKNRNKITALSKWVRIYNSIRLGIIVSILLITSQISFGQFTPTGSETIGNTTTAESQQHPKIAADTTGNYVIVWESFNEDGDDYGIFAQRFLPEGSAAGSQFQVNTTTANGQRFPVVAMDEDSNFVIAWMSDIEDGDGWGIYLNGYNNSGNLIYEPTLVNSVIAGSQKFPAVAMGGGKTVIAWEDSQNDGDVFAKVFNSSGAAVGSAFLVSDSINGHQGMPDVSIDTTGAFVIAWQDNEDDGDGNGIYAQRYDNTGVKSGVNFIVNTTTAENQQTPKIATSQNGSFIISWSGYNQDSDNYGVFARLFDNSGTALTGEISVNTETSGAQENESVVALLDGRYAISWSSYGQDGSFTGVYIQGLNDDGTLTGSETQANTNTDDFQHFSDLAASNSYLIATWQDGQIIGNSTNDGDSYGVFFQLYEITIPPEAVCQDLTIYLDGSGNANVTAAEVDNGSSDDILITSLDIDISSFTCSEIGTNTVTLTVTDSHSNTDKCTSVVTVSDTVSPTAVCQNINVYLDGSGNASIAAAEIDGGSTDNCSSVILGASQTTFTCTNLGANNVTLTVTDAYSNTSDCVAVVTILDTVSPAAVCQNINVYLDGSGNATIAASEIDGGSTDNCSSVILGASATAFTCANLGANNVTLTVTDGSSNTSDCVAVVTILDTVSPAAVCQNINVYLDGSGNTTIAAVDIDGGSTDNCSSVILGASATAFTCADLGANNVTLTVTDAYSNTSDCVAVVTVLDTVLPAAICQNINVFLDGSGNATIVAADIDGGSTDNCAGLTLSASQTAFTCADLGSNNVILTATDGSSNTSDCVAVVTVIDNTNPTISCPGNQIEYSNASCQFTLPDYTGLATTGDNCNSNPTVTQSPAPGTVISGTTTITLTADDGNGNSANCTFDVILNDATAPTAVCQNINVFLDGTGNATIVATDIDGGSADNCAGLTFSASQTAFTCADFGANNVILTAIDGSSNSANCVAVVTVLDMVSPTAVCQDVTVYLDGSGNASIVASDIDGGSTDNCSSVTLSASATAFTCADLGPNNVTLTVTDGSSNTADCVAVVTVLDTVSPTVVCQNLNVYLDGAGNASIVASDIDGGSTDNCSSLTLSASQAAFTCADLGANNVTLTATDGSSNSANCVAIVTVLDMVSPAAVCQDINVYLDGSGNVTIVASDIDGGSTDNCGSVTLSASATAFTCADLGSNNVTLTVTDGSSNSTNCVAIVTVLDMVSPAAVCQDINVYLDGSGNATITATDIDGGSTDNCSSVTLSASATAFTCADLGANNVTLSITDGSSNTSDCVAVVTVLDTVSLVAVCQNINVYLDGSGNATITATDIDGGSTDNCGIDTMWLDVTSFTSADIGDNTVVLTVVDNYGNSLTCSAVVTVKDNTPPDVQCNSIEMFLDEAGNYEITNADIAALSAGTTDNNTSPEDLKIKVWPSLYDCEDIGNQNQVVVYATDATGNKSRCWVYCTVTDTFGMTVEPVADIEIEVDAGVCETTILYPEIISTNKCARFEQTAGLGSNGLFPIGITVETWEVTNARGDTIEVSFLVTVSATNATPSLDALPNIVIDEDSVGVSVMLKGISDGADCDPQEVTVTAVGVNSMLVTDIIINYTSPDSTGMLDLSIAPNRSGTDTITVTVADDMGGTISKIFVLTVNAVNDPPTIDTIADVTIDEDTPTVNVVLTGISSGSAGENQTLTVTAMGENTALVPIISVNYVSPDSTGSLNLAITPLTSGTDTITVTVSDGVDTVTETFVLIVRAINHLPVVVNPVGDKVVNASYVLKIPVKEVFDDADGDTLTYGIIVDGSDTPPTWMEVVGDTILCQPMIADTGCVVVVVTGTDPDGAMAVDTFEICVDGYPTAIGDIDAEIFVVTMYPNPTSGAVNLKINATEIMDSEVVVRSIAGSEVFRKYYKASEQITINLSEHVSGVYLVTLHIGDKYVIKKLILDRK